MADIPIQKINDVKVKKFNLPTIDRSKQVGVDMIDELYANIYVCAKKKSGKTTVLFNILKNSINRDTIVIFFVSTINKDASYKEILKYLDKKRIIHIEYDSLKDGKIDHLKNLIDEMKADVTDDEEEEEKKEKNRHIIIFDEDKLEVKMRKPKKIAPKYLIIFDDISAEIKNSAHIASLIKANRHYKSRVIVSSQYPNDLAPETRSQMDVWILFKGHNLDKLKLIYDASDPKAEFDEFVQMYEQAVSVPYGFFMIDKGNSVYRQNFDHQFVV